MGTAKVTDYMRNLISEIGKFRRDIEAKGNAKAAAMKAYDMGMAKALAILHNSETYELKGVTYKRPPVSIMEKIAKGLCADLLETRELAESDYKACLSNLEAVKAQLNAYQSIYRHLDET